MCLLLAALLLVLLPGIANAQADDVPLVRDNVAIISDEVERLFECEISTHGEPVFDDTSRSWLVSYTASGTECGQASTELQRQGDSADILFVHRPNPQQVRALISGIVRSVRHAFTCRITITDEPSFDESSTVWSVPYTATGFDCDAAAEELGRQGAELRISFRRGLGSRGLFR